jgi:hypothetical protein
MPNCETCGPMAYTDNTEIGGVVHVIMHNTLSDGGMLFGEVGTPLPQTYCGVLIKRLEDGRIVEA